MSDASNTLIIRDARDHERDAIHALTLAAYRRYAGIMTPSAWAGLQQAVMNGLRAADAAQRIVAEREGRLIGSVMLFPPALDSYGHVASQSDFPELRLLAVAEGEQGRGVGRALTQACIERARQMGAAELGLHTSASMQAAIHLYESMGFTRAPERDFQPPGAELVTGYRLRLGEAAG